MSAPIRVAIIGATGKTGSAIVDALLVSPTNFEVTGLTRAASLQSEANNALRTRGVQIVEFDIYGPKEDLVKVFTGQDVVISAVHASQLEAQLNLIAPLKEAKVKRFIPCDFATPAPRGVMVLQDRKAKVLDAVQREYLPYTVIDDGWWYSGICPGVPSGKTDHGVVEDLNDRFIGDGNVPTALTDMKDIGTFTARIIADPRTINKKVFIWSEIWTQKQVYDTIAEVTGEQPIIKQVSADDLSKMVTDGQAILVDNPRDTKGFLYVAVGHYSSSWGVRGDNTPEAAKYLGYLDAHELYPDVKTTPLKEYWQKFVDSKPPGATKTQLKDLSTLVLGN